MKKFGFATVVASGLAAAVLGLAAPASAVEFSTGIDHHQWIHDIQPDVHVPQVDTSVRHQGNR
jgi:hypothetical protein